MGVRPVVVLELAADAKYARELSTGGVYVMDCDLALDSLCDLVVRGASDEAVFDARVVLREPTGGAALELLGFCPAMKQQLEFLIAATPTTQRVEKYDGDPLGGEFDDLIRDVAAFDLGFDEERRAQATEVDDRRPDHHARAAAVDGLYSSHAPRPARRDDELGQEAVARWPDGSVRAAEVSRWADGAARAAELPWLDGPPPASELDPWTSDDDLAVPVETTPDDGALTIDDLDDDDAPAVIHSGRTLEDSAEITLDEPLGTLDLDHLAAPMTEPLDVLDLGDDDDDARPQPAAAPPHAADDAEAAEPGDGDPERRAALTVHERLRRMSLAQQLKKAHTGELQERIVLERMYGKSVWESLLRNPRLTAPEVARIARMGQLPKPLIEIIVGNGGWLQVPEVRRALLSNPRLATDQIMRVLRMLPKHELKLAAVQTAYPHSVRDVAKRMLKETS